MNTTITSSTPGELRTQYIAPTAKGKSREPASKDKAKVVAEKIIKKKESLSQRPSKISAGRIKKDKTRILTDSTKQNEIIKTAPSSLRKEKTDIAMFLSQFTPPNINGFDENGWAPLTYALSEEDPEMVKLLVKKLSANINGVDRNGWTPLTYATVSNKPAMIKQLIELGADINGVDGNGWTPLTYAVSEEKLEEVKLLAKELKADVNKIDGNGWIPLSYAVDRKNPDLVKLLVTELKANINGADRNGWTPLIYAVANGKLEMVKLLKDFGADENLEPLERKFLANVWGIKGFFELSFGKTDKTIKVGYEGLTSYYSMKMLREYTHAFFDDAKSSSIPKEIKDQIFNAIDQGFPLSGNSPAEMTAAVKTGNPLIITAGKTAHAISIVLFKGYLAICNRGEGRKANAVEFYSLRSNEVTEDIINSLTKVYPDVESFNQMIEDLNLGPPLGGYYQKTQKVGNCAWASPKAAVGALFYLYFGEQIVRQLYKEFTGFARERSLSDYYQKSKPTSRDTKLLQAIKEKKENKA